jgi:hypothetical protein
MDGGQPSMLTLFKPFAEDKYEVDSEEGMPAITTGAEDAFPTPPESNLNISFETNSSETRGEHELLAPSSLQQDVAAITITVDGNIVETIIV